MMLRPIFFKTIGLQWEKSKHSCHFPTTGKNAAIELNQLNWFFFLQNHRNAVLNSFSLRELQL